MLTYTVLLHKNEEVPGYSVLVPELLGCFSQGETVEQALSNAKEAIECHLEAIAKDGEELPVERQRFLVAAVTVKRPSTQGSTLDDLFETLKTAIATRSGCEIRAGALDSIGYNLAAPMVFAHVWKRTRKRLLEVVTKKEWADKAQVSSLADKCSDKGYFTWPACHWRVESTQASSYQRAVRALSKICVVRQQLGQPTSSAG